MKLNIGCGVFKKKGYINLDSSSSINPDQVWNLEKTPLPFKTNSIEEINAEHVLEHIQNFVPLINDLWRISKKGAIIKIKVPFYSSWGQFNDPTHVRFFTPFSFNYFLKGNYSHEVNCDKDMFKIKKVGINFGIGSSKKLNFLFNPLLNLNHRFYCRFFAWIFPAAEIEFELEVLK
jgi:hypothetical protein